jgi:hypothetical protein
MRNKLVLILVGLVVFNLAGCSGAGSSELVGKWVSGGETIEFFKDGTGIFDGHAFRWTTENERLRIVFDFMGQAAAYNYTVSGSTLTLIEDTGNIYTYNKE